MTPAKTCCGTISWTFQKRALDDSPDWRRQVLSEVAEAGYEGVEMGGRLENLGVDEVKRLLGEAGLKLVRIGSKLDLCEKLPLIKECGAEVNMVSAGQRGEVGLDGIPAGRFKEKAAELEEEAKISLEEFGIPTGLHNHLWTLAENRHEVDDILDAAPHLQLILDTAHLQAGGGDPVKAIRDYGDRICHVHLKDAHTSIFGPNPLTPGFMPLGEGNLKIDIPGCVRALEAAGYDGWLGVELDMTENPKEDNARSRDFLRNLGY